MTYDVKSLRRARGWSQEEMADYLGLNRSSVSRLEAGRTQTGPVRKLLAELAEKPAAPSDTGAAA